MEIKALLIKGDWFQGEGEKLLRNKQWRTPYISLFFLSSQGSICLNLSFF